LFTLKTNPFYNHTPGSNNSSAPSGPEAVEAAMLIYDKAIDARIAAAASRGKVLRFMARLEHNHSEDGRPRASVRAEELEPTHPFAGLSGAALSVRFHSEEAEQPLVISGAISQKSCVNALHFLPFFLICTCVHWSYMHALHLIYIAPVSL